MTIPSDCREAIGQREFIVALGSDPAKARRQVGAQKIHAVRNG
jgi:hypothetical protein